MPVQLKIGCCGFPVARSRYYKSFEVVEIQSTFYDFVEKKTLEKWRAEAPEGFEFVLKAFQFITHSANLPTYKRAKHIDNLNPNKLGNFQPTKEVFNCYETLLEYAEILKTKFIVFQSPASFKPEKENIKNMAKFFNNIERKGLILGWEPRGKWSSATDIELKTLAQKIKGKTGYIMFNNTTMLADSQRFAEMVNK